MAALLDKSANRTHLSRPLNLETAMQRSGQSKRLLNQGQHPGVDWERQGAWAALGSVASPGGFEAIVLDPST